MCIRQALTLGLPLKYLMKVIDVFTDKVLLITGGTGSFGMAVLDRLLFSEITEIRIFSRDEKKQDDMRKKYKSQKLKFYLGDVRDVNSIRDAMKGVDYVFHAAALKQVPSCEFHPMQALQTNVIGTENVLNAAIQEKVKKVIVLSTDKAVYPINAMGMSKALMEKVVIAKAMRNSNGTTTICCTRYGNVMASRGSVIPLFVRQINQGAPITITNPRMTRFMMTLEQGVDLVLFAFENGLNGDMFVMKSPAASIGVLANCVRNILDKPDHEIKIIGTRHGEKVYESLLTSEELCHVVDMGNFYKIPVDGRDLNYGCYFEQGESLMSQTSEYNSHTVYRLSEDELSIMLNSLMIFQRKTNKDLICE